MHIEKLTGKLRPEGEQTADLHAHLSEVVFGLFMLNLKWKSKTFYKLSLNQKSKLSFCTLYHSVSDAVIKTLQPLLSRHPFSNSKPLGFIFLYFPFENRHLLPLETLSLAQHPFQYWLILKSSIPGQKSNVMNHGGCAGVAPSLGMEEQEGMQEQVGSQTGSPPCQEGLGGTGKEAMTCMRRCKPLVAVVPNPHSAFH